ncbi:MAG: acetolactate synthase large subunit, partial [Myxococcota bacterium]
ALDSVAGIRAVLCLFEGVCTGAADGYGRMTGSPALTLLHLGPGFANGIANLHNARRAHTPIVNLIGDHASWHLEHDAPLTSDVESLARPVSAWVRSVEHANELAPAVAEAIAAARTPPGGVATLVARSDAQWNDAAGPRAAQAPAPAPAVPPKRIARAADLLKAPGSPALLLGGAALRGDPLRRAQRIAAGSGCRLISDTFVPRLERGAGVPPVERLPYFPEQARAFLEPVSALVVVGSRPPVSFFGYRGQPSLLAPDATESFVLAHPGEDLAGALDALAERAGSAEAAPSLAAPPQPEPPTGGLSPETLGAALAATQPEGAIVVDEAATSGLPWFLASAGSPPHDLLGLTGGAIGQGLPCATGAALACPERRVIAFQADGSGAYTLQALWTQAREGLDVTTVLCSNRSYRILQVELARAGIAEPGPVARSLTELDGPPLDWCALARGFGVPASRPANAEELATALQKSFAEPGPHLVQVDL